MQPLIGPDPDNPILVLVDGPDVGVNEGVGVVGVVREVPEGVRRPLEHDDPALGPDPEHAGSIEEQSTDRSITQARGRGRVVLECLEGSRRWVETVEPSLGPNPERPCGIALERVDDTPRLVSVIGGIPDECVRSGVIAGDPAASPHPDASS